MATRCTAPVKKADQATAFAALEKVALKVIDDRGNELMVMKKRKETQ